MPERVKIEKLNILLVEDSETDAYAVKRAIDRYMKHPCLLKHVCDMKHAEATLKSKDHYDLVLLDLGLPDTADAKDTFKRINGINNDIPIIILTSIHDHDLAVGIIDKGAEDFVKKSSVCADPEILCDAMDFAVCRHKNIETLKQETEKLLKEKDSVINWMAGSYSNEPDNTE